MTPLPSLREVTRQLRELNAIEFGEFVTLAPDEQTRGWRVEAVTSAIDVVFGREFVPGDGASFDAVAAARRLLAAARDAEGGK